MANDRERQPELDYYELRRRREQILSQRAKQRPEWDTAPVRRAPAKTAHPATPKEPERNVRQSVTGVDVFPPKQSVAKPMQPKQAPLVRNIIQVNVPEEIPQEAAYQPKHAADAPVAAPQIEVKPPVDETPVEPETVADPQVIDEPVYEEPVYEASVEEALEAADIPEDVAAADVPMEEGEYPEYPEYDEEGYAGPAQDIVDEEISGNNPFAPFVKLAGNMAGKFGEWKQNRAEKAANADGEAKPKKGLKGLFGKKQHPAEEPAWDENAEWTEQPADEWTEQPADEWKAPEDEQLAVDGAVAEADFAEDIPAIEPVTEAADIADVPAEEPAADMPADVVDMPADIAEEQLAEECPEQPAEEFLTDEEFADTPVEEAPKKKFSLKKLFGRKKQSDEDLLAELGDDFDDFDEDDDIDELQEQLEDAIDSDDMSDDPAEEIPVDDEIPVDEAPVEEPAQEDFIAEQPEEIAVEAPVEPAADEPVEEDIPETDADEDDEPVDEEWDEEPEAEETKPKKGLFAFFSRGARKSKDEELLDLLGDDDDDDDDWDDELEDEPYSPEDDAERSYDDMDEKNLIASQMSEGMGERTLSRKERRELAERMAAEAAAAAEPETETAVEETVDEDVDEPTRAFKPVRANRETPSFAEHDDYDDFAEEDEEDEEEQPAPKKKGLFGKKDKKAKVAAEDDFLFDDEDDEPAPKKKSKPAKKQSRYDDDDDYDDYDDYDDDDDDDYDDYDDYDDDEDEGGSVIGGIVKALLTIVLIIVAAVIVLNLLAGRNIGPAQTAVNALGDMLPAAVSEKIFPTWEQDEPQGVILDEVQPVETAEAGEETPVEDAAADETGAADEAVEADPYAGDFEETGDAATEESEGE